MHFSNPGQRDEKETVIEACALPPADQVSLPAALVACVCTLPRGWRLRACCVVLYIRVLLCSTCGVIHFHLVRPRLRVLPRCQLLMATWC